MTNFLENESGGLKKPVIFIIGPTAVGKTVTAIEVAKAIGGEIISADSRQVYRLMDIGTAKPTLRQQTDIPHHLIDILDPDVPVSAGMYRRLALEAVNNIQRRGKRPIFVGGSGLYVNAVLKGIFEESQTNKAVRQKIRQELAENGPVALYNRLFDVDSHTAIKLHINDVKRVTRALEIYEITGLPPSMHFQNQQTAYSFPCRIFVLNMEREELYRRIDLRVDKMISDGLVDEVKRLLEIGYRRDLDALMTLGYREAIQFLDNQCSHEEMVSKIKQNTRRYAKRQLTWFRNQINAKWILVDSEETGIELAGKILLDLKELEYV